jgi:hypothetical protein
MADFTGRSAGTAKRASINYQTAAYTGPKRYTDRIIDTLRCSLPMFSDRGSGSIVIERNRNTDAPCQFISEKGSI